MKERPILFSAPMVRAILEGRKTQTRRIMKPQPFIDSIDNFCWNGWNFGQTFDGPRIQGPASPLPGSVTKRAHCPYGVPGDRLWVRETWADLTATHGRPYERWNDTTGLYERGTEPFIWYRADGEQPDTGNGAAKYAPWRPSISMPRWASRITLEITGVRVERLQDISGDDASAEGIPYSPDENPLHEFECLWESINGPDSWTANPWVWCVSFRHIEATRAAA